MDTLLVDDAEWVTQHFADQLDELHRTIRKTNVLVVGSEGVGKSSIIERVFGLDAVAANLAVKAASLDALTLSWEGAEEAVLSPPVLSPPADHKALHKREKALEELALHHRKEHLTKAKDTNGSKGEKEDSGESGTGRRKHRHRHKRHASDELSHSTPPPSLPAPSQSVGGRVRLGASEGLPRGRDSSECVDIDATPAPQRLVKDDEAQFSHSQSSKYFHKFENDLLRIYDSRGLTAENEAEFAEAIKVFLATHRQLVSHNDSVHRQALRNAVHVVWFIKDARQRLRPFEVHALKDLFVNLPVIVLLNKVDIATDEEVAIVTDEIVALHLSHVAGVFRTHVEARFSEETNRLLDPVIQRTLETLPEMEAEAFLVSQRFNFEEKDARAKNIILDFEKEADQARTPKHFQSSVAKMITRLSVLWNFRQHGHLYGIGMAKDITKGFTFRDRMMLMLHKHQTRHNLVHAAAFGILWNNCVRKLCKRTIKSLAHQLEERAERVIHEKIRREHFLEIQPENPIGAGELLHRRKGGRVSGIDLQTEINESFSMLNEENCCALVERIERGGLETVVDEETVAAQGEHLENVLVKKTWSCNDLTELDVAQQRRSKKGHKDGKSRRKVSPEIS